MGKQRASDAVILLAALMVIAIITLHTCYQAFTRIERLMNELLAPAKDNRKKMLRRPRQTHSTQHSVGPVTSVQAPPGRIRPILPLPCSSTRCSLFHGKGSDRTSLDLAKKSCIYIS